MAGCNEIIIKVDVTSTTYQQPLYKSFNIVQRLLRLLTRKAYQSLQEVFTLCYLVFASICLVCWHDVTRHHYKTMIEDKWRFIPRETSFLWLNIHPYIKHEVVLNSIKLRSYLPLIVKKLSSTLYHLMVM